MSEEKLNKILDNHKLWLDTDGDEGKRANLSGWDLSGVNLSWIDLSYANLTRVNFTGARLRGAKLFAADLRDTCFWDTDLRAADLRSADLDGVIWCGSKREGALVEWLPVGTVYMDGNSTIN